MKTPCLMLLMTAALLGCHRPSEPVNSPRPAVVMTVSDGNDANILGYSGEVRARYENDLSFRVGGKLVERLVNLGDPVRKGQVLARLDPQDIRLSASASMAMRAAAEADLALARAEFERAEMLLAEKFISKSAVDTRRAQLAAAQARLQQAQAQAQVAENQVAYTQLKAPRDGVVTALGAEVGQVLAAGQWAIRTADPAEREILSWIPEARLAQFKPGQAAQVQVWAAPEKLYAGRIREIAASADPTTRTYAIRISLAAPDANLSLGASAAVGFMHATAAAVRVPLAAVMKGSGDQAHVWVLGADNKVVERSVVVDSLRDDVAVLRSGLVAGEKIVTVGAHALSAGQLVTPLAQGAPLNLDVQR